jgi:regulatory protein YycI of two-component signal transduction system YycFG
MYIFLFIIFILNVYFTIRFILGKRLDNEYINLIKDMEREPITGVHLRLYVEYMHRLEKLFAKENKFPFYL